MLMPSHRAGAGFEFARVLAAGDLALATEQIVVVDTATRARTAVYRPTHGGRAMAWDARTAQLFVADLSLYVVDVGLASAPRVVAPVRRPTDLRMAMNVGLYQPYFAVLVNEDALVALRLTGASCSVERYRMDSLTRLGRPWSFDELGYLGAIDAQSGMLLYTTEAGARIVELSSGAEVAQFPPTSVVAGAPSVTPRFLTCAMSPGADLVALGGVDAGTVIWAPRTGEIERIDSRLGAVSFRTPTELWYVADDWGLCTYDCSTRRKSAVLAPGATRPRLDGEVPSILTAPAFSPSRRLAVAQMLRDDGQRTAYLLDAVDQRVDERPDYVAHNAVWLSG
jgi:hypothetical protein